MKSRSLLLVLTLGFMSCATLLKGPYAKVEVVAPPHAIIENQRGIVIPYQVHADGSRYIRLSVDSTQHVFLVLDTSRVLLMLEPSLNASLFLLAVVAGPVSIIVDAATGSWKDFGEASIVHVPDSQDRERALDSIRILRTARRDSLKLGVLVRAGIGVSTPTTQPAGPNQYAFALGYQFNDRLAILIDHSAHWCIDLDDVRGTSGHRLHHFCYASSRHTSLDARVRVVAGLYVTGGIGIGTVNVDTVVVLPSYTRAEGFSRSVPLASLAAGYHGGYLFVEYRQHLGLKRIPIGGDATGALALGGIHFGFNVEF